MDFLRQPVRNLSLGGLAVLFALAGAVSLPAQEEDDKGEAFKQQAREELKRLNNASAKAGSISEEFEDLDIGKSGSVAPEIIPRVVTPQKKERKTEEEEKEEEEERNWLLTGVEKLSGERELTEEDRERLLKAGANASLIDLYVLEKESETEKEEAEKKSEDEHEEIDAPLPSEWILESDGDTKVDDPLAALEKKYVLKGLQEKTDSTENEEEVELAGSKEPRENPYLEAFRSNGILDDLGRNGKLLDLGPPSTTVNPGQSSSNPDNPLKSASVPIPSSTSGNYNPFLDIASLSAIPEAPRASIIPEADTFPSSRSGLTLPGLAPAKPSSLPAPAQEAPRSEENRAPLTDEEYERYFPQLERF